MLSYKEKENYSNIKHFPTLEEQVRYGEEHMNSLFVRRNSQYIRGFVLEVGCSFCYLFPTILRYGSYIWQISGVDINEDELRKGHHFLEGCTINAYLFCGNFIDDPIPESNIYDTILLFHILEHIYEHDDDRFMEVVNKHLNKGGHVLVIMPYGENYTCPEHVNDFNCLKIINLMEKHGLETIDCYREQREHNQKHGPGDYLCGIWRKP